MIFVLSLLVGLVVQGSHFDFTKINKEIVGYILMDFKCPNIMLSSSYARFIEEQVTKRKLMNHDTVESLGTNNAAGIPVKSRRLEDGTRKAIEKILPSKNPISLFSG